MKLIVQRKTYTDNSTIGEMFIEVMVSPFCVTLEPTRRNDNIKILGQTAIPPGTYEVEMRFSQKFDKSMPHLKDVPDFTDIMIHPGNFPKDTAGCILVADEVGDIPDFIKDSKDAFGRLLPLIQGGLDNGQVFVDIIG